MQFSYPYMDSRSMASPNTQRGLQAYMAGIFPLHMPVRFLSPEIRPNHADFMPIRIHNPKMYNLFQQFFIKLLSEIIFYNNNFLRRTLELKHEYANCLSSL